MSDPIDFDSCRHAIDAIEETGIPTAVVAMLRRIVDDGEHYQWVAVADRVPGESMSVIGYCPGKCRITTWMNRRQEWLCDTDTLYSRFVPTHWMPIPEPPR